MTNSYILEKVLEMEIGLQLLTEALFAFSFFGKERQQLLSSEGLENFSKMNYD